jgi:hypothetical protein
MVALPKKSEFLSKMKTLGAAARLFRQEPDLLGRSWVFVRFAGQLPLYADRNERVNYRVVAGRATTQTRPHSWILGGGPSTDPQKSQFNNNTLSWMSELALGDLVTLPSQRIPIWGTPTLV